MFFWYCPCEGFLVGWPCQSLLALFPISFCLVVFPLCHALGSNLGLWDFTYFVLHVWAFCLNVWLYHGCTVPTETRRGLPVLWVWNYRRLWVTIWVMRIKPRTLQEQPVPLISEPFFIPWSQKFEHVRCALHHCCLFRSCDCKCLVWAVILVIMNQLCSWLATSEQWYSFSYLVFTASLYLLHKCLSGATFLRPNLIFLPSP